GIRDRTVTGVQTCALPISTRPEFHIVGEAADSRAATSLAREKRPDVVLLDINTPGGTIAETIRTIREVSPLSEIITIADCDESRSEERRVGKECEIKWSGE